MVEFDLGPARDCFRQLAEKADGDKNLIWTVRVYVKNGLLRAIEIKENGFFRQIFSSAA